MVEAQWDTKHIRVNYCLRVVGIKYLRQRGWGGVKKPTHLLSKNQYFKVHKHINMLFPFINNYLTGMT